MTKYARKEIERKARELFATANGKSNWHRIYYRVQAVAIVRTLVIADYADAKRYFIGSKLLEGKIARAIDDLSKPDAEKKN